MHAAARRLEVHAAARLDPTRRKYMSHKSENLLDSKFGPFTDPMQIAQDAGRDINNGLPSATTSPWPRRFDSSILDPLSKNVIILPVDRLLSFCSPFFTFPTVPGVLVDSRCVLPRSGPTVNVAVRITTLCSAGGIDEIARRVLPRTYSIRWTGGCRKLGSTPSWHFASSRGAQSQRSPRIALNTALFRNRSSTQSVTNAC